MGLSHPVACKVQEKYASPKVKVGTCSMQGFRISMEDDHKVILDLDNHPGTMFVGVFDGHGGAQASKFCARTIHKKCAAHEGAFTAKALQDICVSADSEFLVETNEFRSHGTTCVFSLIDFGSTDEKDSKEYKVTVSNTGDSRCVWGTLRPDAPVKFIQCTDDHKPTNAIERERIAKAGGIVSNGRVDGDLSVSRALGDWQFKTDTTRPLAEQKVSPVPDVTEYKAQEGDWLLLACDGIFERLSTSDVAAFITNSLKKHHDPIITARDLCTYSLDSGSKDNMTVALVLFEDGASYLKKDEPARVFVPAELFPDDPSFMNAYRKFAVDNDFASEVAGLESEGPPAATSSHPPLLQLLAQLASEGHVDVVRKDEDSSDP